MDRSRRALALVLLLAGCLLAALSALALARSRLAPEGAGPGDLLLRAARSQMQATEKLVEAVDDINRRLMVLEKVVLRDEGTASLRTAAATAGDGAAQLAHEVRSLQAAEVLDHAALQAAMGRQEAALRWLALLAGGVGLVALSAFLRPPNGPPAQSAARGPIRPRPEAEAVARRG